MIDDENDIIRMIKSVARGYVLKESDPVELKNAINAVLQKGFYYSEMVTGRLVHSISGVDAESNYSQQVAQLTDREIEFLKLACTEMTYKEIAAKMFLSPRTIDGYRDSLFDKLDIKTRTGLAIYAIKNGIAKI
jgi:two-component system invasion response regulator UvrY